MSISTAFINRPVATTLLCIGWVIAGVLAWRGLPIAAMPEVNVPTIKVSADLPGASPATMVASVATPLERALGRISGVTEMTSVSTEGGVDIRLTFDLSRNVAGAARDVQAALNAARADLPPDMPSSPSYREVSSADAPVMVLALTSRRATAAQMYATAASTFSEVLAQVDGVGEVELVGSSIPAIRVELDPHKLGASGVATEQVRRAIAAAVSNRPTGALEAEGRYLQVATNGQLENVDALRTLAIASKGGATVRLGDVGRVVDAVRDPSNAALANGEPAVLALVRHKPGANIIDVINGINERLPMLGSSLPGDMNLAVIVDRATSVRGSLRDAEHALALAVVLVVIVMLVFLRDVRAALIASAVAPLSMLGAMVVMYFLGYSLDILSLMALTIAVGFTVDDAVVVVENIARHLEDGLPPREAARIGAAEVGPTVLSMSAVLIAVFIPLLLMGGYVGLFVREFAVTLAVVIALSLVVSLTAVPMACAWWLVPPEKRRAPGRFFVRSEQAFVRLQKAYDDSLVWALKRPPLVMLSLLAVIVLSVGLYIVVPKGFFPRQDTGELTGDFDTGGATFAVANEKLGRFMAIVRADPGVASVAGYVERDEGSLFVTLKPLNARDASADAIAARINEKLTDLSGGTFTVTSVQNIRVGGRRSRASNEYTIQADSPELLRAWTPRIVAAMQKIPELRNVHGDSGGTGQATSVDVDRDAAAQVGVTYAGIDTALRDAFAWRRVATVYSPSTQVPVLMGTAPEFAQSTEAINQIAVPTTGAGSVPLPTIAHVSQYDAPRGIARFGQAISATISFDRVPGVSLSQATRIIDNTIGKLAVPTSVRGNFQGSAGAFRQVTQSEPLLVAAAFITLFIVLGILYESCVHPLTILSTLPSAAVGAVFALLVFRTDFDVIAFLGIFALIGIVMKNAIMMVDFALVASREPGVTPTDAILQACRLRLRPILMTSLAVMVAAVPLAVARGDGAEMRQPLGIAMGGGLVVSQILTLYTTPVVYLYLDRFSRWASQWTRRIGAPKGSYS